MYSKNQKYCENRYTRNVNDSKTSSDGLWQNLPTKSDVAQVPEESDKDPEGTRGENHPFHDDWNFFSVQCKINNNQFITLMTNVIRILTYQIIRLHNLNFKIIIVNDYLKIIF